MESTAESVPVESTAESVPVEPPLPLPEPPLPLPEPPLPLPEDTRTLNEIEGSSSSKAIVIVPGNVVRVSDFNDKVKLAVPPTNSKFPFKGISPTKSEEFAPVIVYGTFLFETYFVFKVIVTDCPL